jgi:hypothetical protein
MTERIWDKFLSERDKAVFAAGGCGARRVRHKIARGSSCARGGPDTFGER